MGRALIVLFFLFSFFSQTGWAQQNPAAEEPKGAAELEQQSSFRILRYKPIYFAYSTPLTKVQFSFRSALIEDFRLYFAYSQVIFWKMNAKSKPFLDATYNPELFYRFMLEDGVFKSLDFGAWEHQSNGKSDVYSRSFDQTYLRANMVFDYRDFLIAVSVKASYMYNYDKTNRDIEKFIGPTELQFRLVELFSSWVDKSELSFSLHPGGRYGEDWSRGGYELGYSFRLGGVKVIPSFYAQYFTGYGETLLTYNKREDRLRIGLLF